VVPDIPGPYRVDPTWGVTVLYDPDPGATAKTGTLMATAQNAHFAQVIVDALNERHQRRTRGRATAIPRLH
jgi:hypothetical protein